MTREEFDELGNEVGEIVGFGAVKEYGHKLNESEVNTITEYTSIMGANKNHVRTTL